MPLTTESIDRSGNWRARIDAQEQEQALDRLQRKLQDCHLSVPPGLEDIRGERHVELLTKLECVIGIVEGNGVPAEHPAGVGQGDAFLARVLLALRNYPNNEATIRAVFDALSHLMDANVLDVWETNPERLLRNPRNADAREQDLLRLVLDARLKFFGRSANLDRVAPLQAQSLACVLQHGSEADREKLSLMQETGTSGKTPYLDTRKQILALEALKLIHRACPVETGLRHAAATALSDGGPPPFVSAVDRLIGLELVNPNEPDHEGLTLFARVLRGGVSRNADGDTLLHEAMRGEHTHVAIGLLAVNPDLSNAPNRWNQTPLHLAMSADLAGLLLDHGAEVNATDTWGHTPLHFEKDPGAVELLLRHRAALHARDDGGQTALERAA
jgi:hypothetical protein